MLVHTDALLVDLNIVVTFMTCVVTKFKYWPQFCKPDPTNSVQIAVRLAGEAR